MANNTSNPVFCLGQVRAKIHANPIPIERLMAAIVQLDSHWRACSSDTPRMCEHTFSHQLGPLASRNPSGLALLSSSPPNVLHNVCHGILTKLNPETALVEGITASFHFLV